MARRASKHWLGHGDPPGPSQQAQLPPGHQGGLGGVGRVPFSSGRPRLPVTCAIRPVEHSSGSFCTHVGSPSSGIPRHGVNVSTLLLLTNKGYSWLEIRAAIERDSVSHGGAMSPAVLLGPSISWSPWRTQSRAGPAWTSSGGRDITAPQPRGGNRRHPCPRRQAWAPEGGGWGALQPPRPRSCVSSCVLTPSPRCACLCPRCSEDQLS